MNSYHKRTSLTFSPGFALCVSIVIYWTSAEAKTAAVWPGRESQVVSSAPLTWPHILFCLQRRTDSRATLNTALRGFIIISTRHTKEDHRSDVSLRNFIIPVPKPFSAAAPKNCFFSLVFIVRHEKKL